MRFIGSFSMKRIHARVDVEVTNISRRFPRSRLSLQCDAQAGSGRIVWEEWCDSKGTYLPTPKTPPYHLRTESSSFGGQTSSYLLPFCWDPVRNYQFLPVNWRDEYHLEISQDNFENGIRFRYTPHATDRNPQPTPLDFRRLSLSPQLQMSTRTE
jgi:hypothetical protein